jgi:O-antigen/teichoic acid export membrane protein
MIWKPGKLANGTLILTVGMAARALTQALVFLIVARTLGADGFGSFVAVLTVAGALSSFSGLGASILMVRDIARNPAQLAKSWRYALMAYCLGTPVAASIYIVLVSLILPGNIPWAAILLIGAGEIVCIPLAGFGVFIYQGHEQMTKVSLMQLVPTVARFSAALLFFALQYMPIIPDLLVTWSALYFCSALAAVTYVFRNITKDFSVQILPRRKGILQHIRKSIPFSFSSAAEKLYVDADKFMLARLDAVGPAGLYSAGYRFVDLAFIPLQALLGAATPRYFRHGQSGIKGAIRYSLKIGVIPICYGIAAGCLILWCAPVPSFLLGQAYTETTAIVCWLAWLPLMTVPRMLLHYPLITSGLQHAGMKALLTGAGANIALNLFLIPLWSWRGAVIASYAAEGFMIVVMLFYIHKSWYQK